MVDKSFGERAFIGIKLTRNLGNSNPDLRGVDLSRADFRDSKWQISDFSRTNLSEANLSRKNLFLLET